MVKKSDLPACPVQSAVMLIGNKWKLLIIRNLLERTYRFNELKNSIDGISQKVLTENLRALESDGIVERKIYPEVPPHVEYSLTEIGLSLKPVFKQLTNWSNNYKKILE